MTARRHDEFGAESARPRPQPRAARAPGCFLGVHDEPAQAVPCEQLVELRFDRGDVGKMSAWSYSIVEVAVRGRCGRTSSACRRTRCRIHRLRSRRTRCRKAGRIRQVHRNAADQEARPQPGVLGIHASIDAVVILPCVPATAITRRPDSTCSYSHCGPDTWGARHRESLPSTDCRAMTLPMTNASAPLATPSVAPDRTLAEVDSQ